jgi:hypothetical protein
LIPSPGIAEVHVHLIGSEHAGEDVELVTLHDDFVAIENQVVGRGDVVCLDDQVVEVVVVDLIVDLQVVVQLA